MVKKGHFEQVRWKADEVVELFIDRKLCISQERGRSRRSRRLKKFVCVSLKTAIYFEQETFKSSVNVSYKLKSCYFPQVAASVLESHRINMIE